MSPKRPTPPTAPIFELTALEGRRLLSVQTPAGPRPEAVLNDDMRRELIAQMPNLPDGLENYLTDKANNGQSGAFDQFLALHFEDRTDARFYFDETEVDDIGAFLNDPDTGVNVSDVTGKARSMVYDRLVGESESRQPGVRLADDIDWLDTTVTSNGDFLHTLNRHFWWPALAQAAAIDGDPAYLDDLEFQLADWSSQYVTANPPAFWSAADQGSWWFDTAIRAEYWTWTYFTALGDEEWSDASNVLMLYKLNQQGEYLLGEGQAALAAGDFSDNRVLTIGKTLQMMGVSFPEFAGAGDWEATGRALLHGALEGQFFADGSHVEQSPGYAQGAINDLFDAYLLDKANGKAGAWSALQTERLGFVADAYNQFVTPDGRRPALGDTYRTVSVTHYLKSAVALDRADVSTTTVSALNFAPGEDGASVRSVTVADASGYSVGDHVMEEGKTEVMRVVGVSGNTVEFERAFAGGQYNGLEVGETLVNFSDTPLAKPRQRDAWLLGEDVVDDYLKIPAAGLLGPRGQVKTLTAGGNYIFRDESEQVQFLFDAGPKGGVHGHYDLLGFELFGGDRPLIADPGPYKYIAGTSAPDYNIRESIVSTLAHNTINVDRQNHGALEQAQARENVTVYGFEETAGDVQISATHNGYAYLTGSPEVGRSVWYDKDGTFVIVDWGKSTKSQDYGISFTLPADGDPTNWIDAGDYRYARSRHGDGGKNVILKSLELPGQSWLNNNAFVTNVGEGDYLDDAKRLAVRGAGTDQVFVTLVQAYDGNAVPGDTLQALATPTTGGAFTIRLNRDGGGFEDITFTPPPYENVSPEGPGLNAFFHDVAYGADGRLHMAYLDRTTDSFRYTVKDEQTGAWSEPSTIDDDNAFVGYYADLQIDRNGNPGVSYFDGYYGDLKYAWLSEETNAWEVETIDAKKSVGLYTSLAYSRNSNAPIISYHHRSNGELRVASKQGVDNWLIEVVDGGAVSGTRAGQFSQIAMDPNRTDVNGRWVVAYADTTRNTFKFGAYNGSAGFTIEEVDPNMGLLGGYLSLGFVDSGTGHDNAVGGDRWQPVMSYYESAPGTALRYAYRTKTNVAQPGDWTSFYLDGNGGGKRGGLYTSLQVVDNRPTIFHFDSKETRLKRVRQLPDGSWDYNWNAPVGGRLISTAQFNGTVAYTNLDITNGEDVTVAFA